MARRTVIGDGLPIGTGVAAVMTTEAARRIIVPKIVRMGAPGHAHVRENIPQVDLRNLLTRLLHQRPSRLIDLRVIRPIKIVDSLCNALLCHFASGIIHLQNFDRLFPDVGKIRTNPPQ